MPLCACPGIERPRWRDESSEQVQGGWVRLVTSAPVGLIAIVFSEYDPAISSFVDVAGFGFSGIPLP